MPEPPAGWMDPHHTDHTWCSPVLVGPCWSHFWCHLQEVGLLTALIHKPRGQCGEGCEGQRRLEGPLGSASSIMTPVVRMPGLGTQSRATV